MKRNLVKALIVVLLLTMSLGIFSCGKVENHYDAKDYILEMDYEDDFRILQLSDIHVGNKDDRQKQYDFIDLTIKDADADLIIITGDSFTFADRRTAKEFVKWMDGHDVPWAITFGNHDEQCYFSVDWLTNLLNNYGSYLYFKDFQDDDVFGNANFAINLMDEGKVKEQIIIMDSNRYNYGEYIGYDYFKQNQIDWYERIVNYTTEQNGGEVVDSLMFFHIPLPEFQEAWDKAKEGDPEAVLEYGEINEPCSVPKINSGFFDKIVEMGSTRGIFVGHDHIDNFRIFYKGMYLAYGVNSTDRIYYNDQMIGGHVIVIHDDNSLTFEHIYHSYEEVK